MSLEIFWKFLAMLVTAWKLTSTVNKTIISDTTDHYLTLTFRSLPEIIIRRRLFSSSGSCHGRVLTWQEISRACG